MTTSTNNLPAAHTAQPAGARGASGSLLIALYAAVFMVAAEGRVIAPLLPAIANDFGTTVTRAGSLITLTMPLTQFPILAMGEQTGVSETQGHLL